MELVRCYPQPVDVVRILAAHRLLPDAVANNPHLAAGLTTAAEFYLIQGNRDRTLGLVWLADIVPGASCSMHVILQRRYRRFLKPARLERQPQETCHGKDKLKWFDFLLRRAFETHNCLRITGTVPRSRRAAMRLNERMGFRYEGVLRDAVSFDGETEDVLVYGMTRKDWHGNPT